MDAFNSHDFAADEKWKSYVRNVELIDNSEAAFLKLKGKWYKKNVDPTFDVSWIAPAVPESQVPSKASRRPAPSSYRPAAGSVPTSTPASESASTAQPRPSYTSPIPPSSPPTYATKFQKLQHTVQVHCLAVLHLMIMVLAVLYLVASVAQPHRSAMLFRSHLQVVFVTHLFKIFMNNKLPPFRPFNMSAFKEYFQTVLSSTDAHYALVGIIFRSLKPFPPIMYSPTVLAAYHFAAYCKKQFGTSQHWQRFVEPQYQKLLAAQASALQLNAMVDILSALGLIVTVMYHKSYLLPFVYVNQLKSRYRSRDAAGTHEAAWRVVGTYVDPILVKVPALATPIQYAKTWFLQSGR